MNKNSLWGQEFNIQPVNKTEKILNKVSNPKKVRTVEQSLKSKSVSIDEKLNIIKENVDRILGGYSSNTIVIKTKQEFFDYIDKSIANGVIAIDTETNNSLDPLTCMLMGACIYTPGQKNAYIPVNHVDKNTHNRLDWQLTESDIKEGFDRLVNTNIIMHNGKFDYKVIKCTCDCELNVYWDTMICAKVLNENERAGLKQQYIEKVDSSIEKYSIESLFENIPYELVDPSLFALYAATDAYMTYRLYELQEKELKKEENKRLFYIFSEVEMPLVKIIGDMELTGVCIDLEYGKRLSKKFHKKLDSLNDELNNELIVFNNKISMWRLSPDANTPVKQSNSKNPKTKNEQLTEPININSPTQLAILFYDILGVKPVSKKMPRSTGEDALKYISKNYNEDISNIASTILKIRGVEKLLGTYIDKIPTVLSKRDGKLHGEFLQFGADTGRFSSKNPNLQNIPARGDVSVRRMFTASPGYTFVGSDYSQQEPRLLAHYSHDESMINAYKDGKDLYAMIASKVYNNNYEDNKEFFPDGTMNPEGKHRRTSCKSLLLGIMYGMGDAMTAERIGCSISEAKKIRNDFFNSFPNVKKWVDETHNFVHKYGYVEDVWGRRRRLPDINLNRFEITSGFKKMFNPLLKTSGENYDYNDERIKYYLDKLNKCSYRKEIEEIKNEASSEGITIKDNSGFIATAERQSVNARVQGGSATMSKRAIVALDRNKRLKELGFRPLILVHDEIIGECPIENQDEVKEILSTTMIEAAKPEVITPMKCDADSFISWYDDVYGAEMRNNYSKMIESGLTKDETLKKLYEEYSECTVDEVNDFIENRR